MMDQCWCYAREGEGLAVWVLSGRGSVVWCELNWLGGGWEGIGKG